MIYFYCSNFIKFDQFIRTKMIKIVATRPGASAPLKSLEQASPPWTQGKALQAPRTRRRRRRGNGKWGGGIPFLGRLGGLGERTTLPQRDPGQSPGEKRIWCILNVTEHFWLQDIVNHENSVLQAEMQYAITSGQQTWALGTARTNIRDISRINHTVTSSLATLSSSSLSSLGVATADWHWHRQTRQTRKLDY